ncbi:cation diffusion facilitator CzcD-associated flavoprotein CzcO [Actinokineospora baliensis]|uniref:hypothetical protein n=1 Tax=Actinokineospora baliensis TaxID=547056 RepID=UPI00195DE4E8|nr:hypothetical protein [Actinokineospora baliensis]MBM7770814.1 cation diffusion facilitator CzcD-associated flavoprotein CzcO [Actinokineospora baliensis]
MTHDVIGGPLSVHLVVTALLAGAAATTTTTTTAAADAYAALTAQIRRVLHRRDEDEVVDAEVAEDVHVPEQRAALTDTLVAAGAGDDPEVLAHARHLLVVLGYRSALEPVD